MLKKAIYVLTLGFWVPLAWGGMVTVGKERRTDVNITIDNTETVNIKKCGMHETLTVNGKLVCDGRKRVG